VEAGSEGGEADFGSGVWFGGLVPFGGGYEHGGGGGVSVFLDVGEEAGGGGPYGFGYSFGEVSVGLVEEEGVDLEWGDVLAG